MRNDRHGGDSVHEQKMGLKTETQQYLRREGVHAIEWQRRVEERATIDDCLTGLKEKGEERERTIYEAEER
jgi:hypothetical protein